MKLIITLLAVGYLCFAQVQISSGIQCYQCAYVEKAPQESNSKTCEKNPIPEELKEFHLAGRGSDHLSFLNQGVLKALRQTQASPDIPNVINGLFLDELEPTEDAQGNPKAIFTYCMTVTGTISGTKQQVVIRNAAYLRQNVGPSHCENGQPADVNFFLHNARTCFCYKDGCNGAESTQEGGSNDQGGKNNTANSVAGLSVGLGLSALAIFTLIP